MKRTISLLSLAVLLLNITACRNSKTTRNTTNSTQKGNDSNAEQYTGGATGYALVDKLSTDLQGASNNNVVISKENNEINISFEPAIVFESNSDELVESSKEKLTNTAKILSKYEYLDIFIEGHADSSGVQKKNKGLSQARAKNVALFLKKNGVKTERLAISGYGATKPIASNETPDGRRKNRRVYIKIRAKEAQFDLPIEKK